MIWVGSLCFNGAGVSDAVRAHCPSPQTTASCFGQENREGIQINSHPPWIHFQKQLQRGQGGTQRDLFLTALRSWSSSGLKEHGSKANNCLKISWYVQNCCNEVILQSCLKKKYIMLIKAVFVWLKMQLNTYNAWNTRESMILQKSLNMLIWCSKTFVFINIETVVLPNIFVETKDSLMNIKLKLNIFEIYVML